MSVPTLERIAQKRVGRTRTRAVSALPALSVSTLRPHEYDLRPACISLVCPSCRTWVPINKPGTLRPKLVPHHMEEAGTEDPRRCPGSHRLVVLDIDIERWWQRLTEGVAETDGRRSNRVTRKPKATVAPAVMQIVTSLVDDKTARRMDEAHVKGCRACAPGSASRCTDGHRLAHLAAHTKRIGPARRKAQAEQEEWADRREWGLRLLREAQWNTISGPVRHADVHRLRHQLEAMCWSMNPKKPEGPRLSAWQQAELLSSIIGLAKQVDQLDS
ncbi:hypothetical protein ACFVJK_33100 [Streptomyces sp. NPDC127172]|uniref:hypothetical protein n=1 Tax=Streptomyces sp. NPDC127172 TaxID=3345382 RepID=UPI00363C3D8C